MFNNNRLIYGLTGGLLVALLVASAVSGGAPKAKIANKAGITEPEDEKAFRQVEGLEKRRPQEALEKYQAMVTSNEDEARETVMPSKVEPHLYYGLRTYAIGRMRGMANGHDLYEKRYGVRASTGLPGAIQKRSIERLQKIVALYPLSKAARKALQTLGRIHFEQARFGQALQYWERCLGESPESQPLSVLDMARAAYASAATSRPANLAALTSLAAKAYAEDTLLVGGKKGKLVDYMRSLKGEAKRVKPQPVDFTRWPSSYGNAANNRQFGFDVDADARRWVFARLFAPDDIGDPIYRNDSVIAHNETQRASKEAPLAPFDPTSPYLPVVHDGTLYVNTGRALHAIRLDGDGAPLWQAPASGLAYMKAPMYDHEDVNYGATVSDGRIYASLLLRDSDNDAMIRRGWPGKFNQNFPPHSRLPNRLICVDAKTGEVVWKTDKTLAPFGYVSSPLKSGDRLYALATERLQPSTTVSILALSARSGAFLYKTPISSLREDVGKGPKNNPGPIPSPLAESAGRLYFSTNLGTIACVEAATGHIVWLRRYSQDRLKLFRALPKRGTPRAPRWYNNAPVIQDGVVYFTPTDSSKLYALDAATGRTLNEMAFDNGSGRYILGLGTDRLLVVCGGGARKAARIEASLIALSLRDPAKPKVYTGKGIGADKIIKQIWSQKLPGLCGRPAVSDKRIYVPTTEALLTFDPKNGKPLKAKLAWTSLRTDDDIRRRRPAGRRTAGNILVLGDVVVSSSRYEISVLHNLKNRLAAIRAAGKGPRKEITVNRRLAATYLRAGKIEQAHEHYGKALAALDKYTGATWTVLDGSSPATVKGKRIYLPRRIGVRDALKVRRMQTAYELAMKRLDKGRFDNARQLLQSMTATRVTVPKAMRAIRFDDSSPVTARRNFRATHIRYTILSSMARGGMTLLHKRKADRFVVDGKGSKALAEYALTKKLWAGRAAFHRLPPFAYASPGQRSLKPTEMEAQLTAGILLANTVEGERLYKAGKKNKAIEFLKKGMVRDTYRVGKQPPRKEFHIHGMKETSVAAVAARTRALLRKIYMERFKSLAKKNDPAAAKQLAEAAAYAPARAEKIALLVAEAQVYKKLGRRDKEIAALKNLAAKHGKVIHTFPNGKKDKVADYVARRLKVLQPQPKPKTKPNPGTG